MAESHDMGAYAEAVGMAFFNRQGYQVYQSQGSHSPADLTIEREGIKLSVEIRLAGYKRNGQILAPVKKTTADLLLIVHPEKDSVWLIPGVDCCHLAGFQIGRWYPTKTGKTRKRIELVSDDYRIDNALFRPYRPTTVTDTEVSNESSSESD